MRVSIAEYAKSIGKTRGAVNQWANARKNGKKSNLPKDVRIDFIAGRKIVRLTGSALVEYRKFIKLEEDNEA